MGAEKAVLQDRAAGALRRTGGVAPYSGKLANLLCEIYLSVLVLDLVCLYTALWEFAKSGCTSNSLIFERLGNDIRCSK